MDKKLLIHLILTLSSLSYANALLGSSNLSSFAKGSPWKITTESELPTLLGENGGIKKLWESQKDEFLSVDRDNGKNSHQTKVRLNYRKFIAPNSSKAIVILHGTPEYIGKYRELIYDFYNQGYSVYIFNQRGYGRSDRFAHDLVKTHIDDFSYFVQDLHSFITQVIKPMNHRELFLFAHSMGGGVSALFLENYPDIFKAAVLSVPMIEINTRPFPHFAAKMLVGLNVFMGRGENYAFGQGDRDPTAYTFEEACTSSLVRFNSYRKFLENEDKDPLHPLRMLGPTNQWVFSSFQRTEQILKEKNAKRIKAPILLFSARNDIMVRPRSHHAFCSLAPNCKLEEVDAKHEIYFEADAIRIPYLKKIFEFYQKSASPSSL